MDVARVEPVLEDPDAIGVEAADHRPAGAATVAGGRDSWLGRERVAEGGVASQRQLLVGEDVERRRDLVEAARAAGGGHGDRSRMDVLIELDLDRCDVVVHNDPHHGISEPQTGDLEKVLARCDLGEGEATVVVGGGVPPQLDDTHPRTGDRRPVRGDDGSGEIRRHHRNRSKGQHSGRREGLQCSLHGFSTRFV